MTGKASIETSDLYFAAYLQTIGCKRTEMRKEGNKAVFTFEDEKNRPNLKEAYFSEEQSSAVPALTFANAIRSLKTLCYVRQ